MKIEKVETFLVEHWLLVKIYTDSGLVGVGEGGVHGFPQAVQAMIQSVEKYLIGKDPLRIEHLWQSLYRFSHFAGAVVTSGIAAIDIALWDIKGKYYQAPVYELMGGKCRDKIRVYIDVGGNTLEELAESAKSAVREGFTAVRLGPTGERFWEQSHGQLISEGVERVAAVREAVGPYVDVSVEIHRRMTIPEAITFGKEIEQFRPFFYEDPIRPDSAESMSYVAKNVPIPIATGERLCTSYEFRELLQMRGCQYIRPDLCLAGGLTHCKKISAVAESFNVGVIPHNPLSPISTAACVQLDACIPNFVLQEYRRENRPPTSDLVNKPYTFQDGYLILSDNPGLGIELDDDFIEKYQWDGGREIVTNLHPDGSVADC